MKCIPEDVSRADVAQWLQGGWFFWKRNEEATMQPAQLVPGDGEYMVRLMDGTDRPMHRTQLYPHWPQCGAVNLDGFAVYIERQQVRQYRRTYNDMCLTVDVARKWDVMKKFGTDVVNVTPNTPAVVNAAFNPKYYSYSDALDLMETGRAVSVALNRNLVVAGPLVYYRNKLVAKITGQHIVPVGVASSRISRILKFFEGRVSI